jgi:membrane protease YdiL (CAAX protease family)
MFDPSLRNLHKSQITVLIIGILLAVLLSFGIGIVRLLTINYHDKIIYSEFAKWIIVVFLFFYAYRVEKQPLLIWSTNDTGIGFTLLSVLVLYVAYVLEAIVSVVPYWFGYRDTDQAMRLIMQSLRGHPLLIFFVSITAGVTEELIFRAYVLTRLSTLFKDPYIPIIASSVIFSALHYKYHSLGEFIFTFCSGSFVVFIISGTAISMH